jgi:hypothetical protein
MSRGSFAALVENKADIIFLVFEHKERFIQWLKIKSSHEPGFH